MPMHWPHRKLEKNQYLVDFVLNECGYKHFYDLSYFEKEGKALEGRGCSMFDWIGKTVYAGESNRVHEDCLKELVNIMNKVSKTGGYKYYLINAWDIHQNMIPFHTSCYF